VQIVLRFLPQALIIIALAVVVVVVARKLPKTAKIEAELAAQKNPAKAAKKTRSAQLGAAGALASKAGKQIGRGALRVARVVGGRLGKVLKIAERRRTAKVSPVTPVSVAQQTGTGMQDEKQRTILQLLREAEDYGRQANWQAAEKVYIKVVALAPKTLEAYVGLGNLYMKQKNWNDSAEAYKVVLEGDKNNLVALSNLGLALANKGEWVAAADALQRAAKLDPGNATRHATLGMAYMTIKEYKKAVRAYREAVKHDRENLSHKVELAKAAHLAGDKATAEEMLTSVLARDPLNEQAKTMLAEVRATNKELE
jgi:tetratricopeptide (TPR) repeat protein